MFFICYVGYNVLRNIGSCNLLLTTYLILVFSWLKNIINSSSKKSITVFQNKANAVLSLFYLDPNNYA